MNEAPHDVRCPHCGLAPVKQETLSIVNDKAIFRDRHVVVTPTQGRMLTMLATRRVISRTTFYQELYWHRSEADEPEPRTIDVQLVHLRRKIEPLGLKIITIWGQGWQLGEADA